MFYFFRITDGKNTDDANEKSSDAVADWKTGKTRQNIDTVPSWDVDHINVEYTGLTLQSAAPKSKRRVTGRCENTTPALKKQQIMKTKCLKRDIY